MTRAFVIGNGPSLTSDQLDLIHKNEDVSFGVNRIHLIYPETKWRPTNWVIMDFSNSIFYKEDIEFHSRQGYPCYLRNDIAAKYIEGCIPIFPNKERVTPLTDNLYIIDSCGHIDSERFTSDGWHEDDPAIICKMGGSVPAAIQMAVKWGHNPIYLIGMDGNKRGNAENNFIAGYIDIDAVGVQKAAIANRTTELALTIAHGECNSRGVKLLDATVGGSAYHHALDRVDFYELFV